MRLKEDSTAFLRHSLRSGEDMETSVVRKQSIVARFGAIIPAPFVIPPIVTSLLFIFNLTAMSFCFVSVVIMARATLLPCVGVLPRDVAAVLIPAKILSIGRGLPIIPVEATRISSSEIFRHLAAVRAISSASLYPCSPVQALALPLLITNARMRPFWATFLLSFTGAA